MDTTKSEDLNPKKMRSFIISHEIKLYIIMGWKDQIKMTSYSHFSPKPVDLGRTKLNPSPKWTVFIILFFMYPISKLTVVFIEKKIYIIFYMSTEKIYKYHVIMYDLYQVIIC